MSNIIDGDLRADQQESGKIRFAYSINNEQPVRCTIVSDQPLFYMDLEGDIEEDYADQDEYGFAYENLDEDISSLRDQINSLNRHVRFSVHSEEREFISPMIADYTVSEKSDIAVLIETLAKSRMAQTYLEFANEHKIEIRHSNDVETGLYDRSAGRILINPVLQDDEQILLIARELRRIWQHKNGALLKPITFHPDQAILVNRAQQADLSINMIRIAWELQLAGEVLPWTRLETSSMGDMARSFAREAFLNFTSLDKGIAASATFETWFLSERCRGEDKKIIQSMLADYSTARMECEHSSLNVTRELIVALGSMPYGKNYLAPYVETIISDPVFTEVRDRSNANFLWFIKFERSFQEAEQELQNSGHIPNREIPREDYQDTEKRSTQDERTQNVIWLESHRSGNAERKVAAGSSQSAQIIAFCDDTIV